MEVLGCGVMEQAILDKNYGEGESRSLFCYIRFIMCYKCLRLRCLCHSQQVMEVLGCGVMEQAIMDKNYGEGEWLLLCCLILLYCVL
jgi:hypothetical protein